MQENYYWIGLHPATNRFWAVIPLERSATNQQVISKHFCNTKMFLDIKHGERTEKAILRYATISGKIGRKLEVKVFGWDFPYPACKDSFFEIDRRYRAGYRPIDERKLNSICDSSPKFKKDLEEAISAKLKEADFWATIKYS